MPPPTRSADGYEALLQRAGLGLFRASVDGTVVDANAALARMLGYADSTALRSANLRRDVFLESEEFDQLLATAGDAEVLEWVETHWRKQDGTPVTVRLTLRQSQHGDHGPRIEGIVEDVTERRRQEELLRRNERLASLGTTLAGVAHELNNPLAAVMGFAQLLLKREWPEEDRTALETISHEAERSAKIVKDLLSLARQREVDRRAPVNLNDVVGYIVRTRRYALETFGIACELKLDPLLPLVCGDRAQLEQVVLNLVSNAEQALRAEADKRDAQAPAERPMIRVRTQRDAEMAVLEVEDNGPGIPENNHSRIWDPFFTTRTEGEGTGLGLSLVNHIVAEHAGEIAVETSAPAGVKFIVRLPIASEGESAPESNALNRAERALDILVVGSDPSDQRFLQRFLRSRGHAVLAAADAERARRLGAQTTFDAVVLDLGAEGDAPLVMAELREAKGCAAARFVLAAHNADAASSFAAQVGSGEIVLLKPYDVEQLRRAVEVG